MYIHRGLHACDSIIIAITVDFNMVFEIYILMISVYSSAYLPTTLKKFPGHWEQFSGIFKSFPGLLAQLWSYKHYSRTLAQM